VQAFYWLQAYYYKFWYAKPSTYQSENGKGVWYNGYGAFALAESISVITMVVVYVINVLLWCLTATNIQWLILWYLNWNSLVHYIDGLRFLWLIIVRTIALWADHPTTYYGYKKLTHEYEISKEHFIDVWDFAMEFAALTIQFGFYPDLKSIKYIKPKKAGKKAEKSKAP